MDTYHPGDRKRCRMVIWEDGTISFGLSVLPKHSQVELGPPWDRRLTGGRTRNSKRY